ncbi:hypothetical protein AQUCO_12200005v1 [Aquilegia coerulea]|uniref:XS domain-containing protein n=1 Tax=Aquilegia coerulea TaxID=218851 RepID=A0A2G5C1S3_AQUCA|nr:hypothetical protein AQUCO_12200005v1 [Aquilegia coerulea]
MRPRRPGHGGGNRSPPPRRRPSPRFTDERRRHNDSYTSYRSQVDERHQHQERPPRSFSPPRAGRDRSHKVVISPYRRSLSPPCGGKERPQRVVMSPRRRNSVERRDYSRVSDGGYGDRLLKSKNRSPHYDDQFRPKRDSSPNDYHRKYSLSERTNQDSMKYIGGFDPAVSRANREKDSFGSGSSALNGRMYVHKSSSFDDGFSRTHLPLPSNDNLAMNSGKKYGDSFLASSSSRNLTLSLHKDDDLRYIDYQNPAKIPLRDVPYHMMPPSQSKAFESTPSALRKEDSLGPYNDCLPLPSDGFGKSNVKFSESFTHAGYRGDPTYHSARDPKDVIYQHGSLSLSRGQNQDYVYHETGRREKIDSGYPSDEVYRKMQPGIQEGYANGVPSRKQSGRLDVDTLYDRKSSQEVAQDGIYHQSLQQESLPSYLNMNRELVKARDLEPSSTGRKYLEFGARVYGDHDSSHPRKGCDYGMEAGPEYLPERLEGSPKIECNPDMYSLDTSHEQRKKVEDVDKYDQLERARKRKFTMDQEINRPDPRSTLSSTRNISRQVHELTDVEEHCTGADPDALPSSKPSVFSRLKYKKIKREKASCRVPVSQRLSSHGKGRATKRHILNGRKLSIKMRLKPASVNELDTHNLDKLQDLPEPETSRKISLIYQNGGMDADTVGSSEDKFFPLKADPPEGSVEFKQLVHRAFLRFSKQLNETSAQRKRYKGQGEAGTLLCSICGSTSKAFANSHSLASHAFVSSKAGLRADHLGLHKALCVLMGWNSDVTGSTWVRQILPDPEALAIKEDLILWPPLVIIHNSSIGSKNPDEQKVVTVESMEAILAGMYRV